MVKVLVELGDIFTYVGVRQRPLVEGEAVFKAGHVILCQLADSGQIKVFGLVLQTSGLTSPPHEVNLNLKGGVSQWQCVCSCKAGQSGFCKHVIGCLIYINRFEDLELLSSTDVTQRWGKEKQGLKVTYDETKVSELCHPARKTLKRTFASCSAVDKANLELLVKSTPGSALNVFMRRAKEEKSRCKPKSSTSRKDNPTSNKKTDVRITPVVGNNREGMFRAITDNIQTSPILRDFVFNVPELKACCKSILQNLEKTEPKQAALNVRQNTSAWNELRRLRITGSRCYAIYTYQGDDWHSKAVRYFWPKSFFSKYTKHGQECEAMAVTAYKRKHPSLEIFQCGFIAAQWPWIGYSPDGIIFQNNCPIKLLEVKCPYSGREIREVDDLADKCNYLIKHESGKLELKSRHAYYAQIQLGMAVLKLPKTELIIYSSATDDYLSIIVNFDLDFATSLLTTVSERFFTNMLHVYCENKDEI